MEESYICKFCGKVCKNANSLRNHERLCKENPDRKIDLDKLKKASFKRNSVPWNKGLNKDIDPRIGKQGGNWKGKKLSKEHKQSISNGMKKAHKNGKAHNIGTCRWNNEHSWPEKWLIKVLDNEFDLKENEDYKTEFSFDRFSLDFAWPSKKLCIEVDGKQHQTDNAQKLRDAAKDKLLLENGWKELRIPWLECYKNPKNWIEIVREFLKGE